MSSVLFTLPDRYRAPKTNVAIKNTTTPTSHNVFSGLLLYIQNESAVKTSATKANKRFIYPSPPIVENGSNLLAVAGLIRDPKL